MSEPTMSQFATELDCLRARVEYFQKRAEAAEAKLRETEEYFRCELSRFGNPYINSVVLRHPDYDEVMQIIDTSPSPNGLHVVIKRN